MGSTNGEGKPPSGKTASSVHHTCRYLKQAHEARGAALQVVWAKGHAGIAGNECDDDVANAFAGRPAEACSLVPSAAHAIWAHPLLPWAWMLWDHRGLPTLSSFATSAYEPADRPSLRCIQQVIDDVQLPHGPSEAFRMRLCTANVCSLLNKQQLLMHQLSQHEVSICALQETRYASDSVFMSDGWICHHSAGQRGHKGCALWVHAKRLQTAARASVPVAREHFAVLSTRGDWLAVRLKWGVLDCIFVVLHAPHTGHPEALRKEWWSQAQADLDKLGRTAPLVVMGDFNAVVSRFDTPAVGALAGEIADFSGELAGDTARQLGLRLVNTFPSAAFPSALQPTWKHKCIDYIAVPKEWMCGAAQLGQSIDLGDVHDDHQAVLVEVCLPAHRQAFRAPSARPHGRSRRAPTWACNVHEHAEILFREARRRSEQQTAPIFKPFFSEASKALLARKKEARRALRDAQGRNVAQAQAQTLEAAEQFKKAAKDLAISLKADKAAYIVSIADSIRDASSKTEGQHVFHALRFFRPAGKNVKKPFRALPVLCDEKGTVASSFTEQQQLRGRHYGDMEAAIPMTAAERLNTWPCTDVDGTTFALLETPTLLEVEGCLRGLPVKKAAGPSGVANEVWKSELPKAARQWFPVFAKAHKRLTEPFRFSVGTCVSLAKGLGPATSLSSFRSVFLLEGLGKGLRKLARTCLVRDIETKAPPLFAGCLPGSLTGALTHYLVTFFRIASNSGHTAGVLFLDAKSAYYRALRSRLTGESFGDAVLCSILHTMGVDKGAVDAILAWSNGPPLFDTLSRHQQRFLAALFKAPAFLLRGIPLLYSTQSGTRPGDSIADVLFAAILVNGILAVQDRLREAGIVLPVSGEAPPLPTWADDTALPLAAATPDEFWSVAKRACNIIHTELGSRAIELAYREDKSALLVAWKGAGSRKMHGQCLTQGTGLSFDALGGSFCAPMVSSYVHLGTKIGDKGAALPDLRRKFQQASARVKPVAGKVLRRTDIPLDRRRLILQSIGMSVAQYNVSVWGTLTGEEHKVWNSGVDSLYRLLYPEDRHGGEPDCPTVFEVCGKALLPCPQAVMSVERIRHAARLVRGHHLALWEALATEHAQSSESWLHELIQDLEWVRRWVPGIAHSSFIGIQPDELAVWLDEASRRCDKWAVTAARLQTLSLHRWFRFQLEARRSHEFHGVAWARRELLGDTGVLCPVCGDSFPSGSHLSIHAVNAHSHICLSRLYTRSSRCRACLKEHWTITRMRRHLSSGPACLAFLIASVQPMNAEQVAEADGDNAVHLRVAKMAGASDEASRRPVIRAPGPLRPVPEDAEAELAVAWAGATPFERVALARSLQNFAAQFCETLSIPVEAEPLLVMDRAHCAEPPRFPDGDSWIRTVHNILRTRVSKEVKCTSSALVEIRACFWLASLASGVLRL